MLTIPTSSRLAGISITCLLATLQGLGINSLMVEGGQRIISSFLSHLDAEHKKPVVDVLIITVAPTLVGAAGIGMLSQGPSAVIFVI